jgi:hypothetical protein
MLATRLLGLAFFIIGAVLTVGCLMAMYNGELVADRAATVLLFAIACAGFGAFMVIKPDKV